MSREFLFRFDELPLAIVYGIEAAFISGQAEIEILGSGYFKVGGVSLEGFGERVGGVRQWPMIPAPHPIAVIVRERLNTEWRKRVLNACSDHLEDAA